MKIKEEELTKIKGGISAVPATLINAFARAGQFLYDLGRNLGTAVHMIGKKKRC